MKKFLAITVLAMLIMSCNSDGSSSDTTSKLDLCLSVVEAFCSKVDSLNCDYSDCRSENNAECKSTFTGDCAASANEIFMFEDEIPTGWINTKTSCSGLESLYTSIETEVTYMATSGCATTGGDEDEEDNSNTKTNGEYCDEILGILCDKVIEYNCYTMDKATCMSNLYSSGIIYVTATYACTSSADSTVPDDSLKSSFEDAKDQANSVSTCQEMGFE